MKARKLAASASSAAGIIAALPRRMTLKKNGAAAALRLPGVRTKGDVVASRYRVEAVLGKGSNGFVVAARHVQLRHPVRLKILTSATRAQQKGQRKFLAQAHQAAALQGPHVARVVDTGFTDDGDAFIATEALDGKSLADELKAHAKIAVEEAVRWMIEACAAVGEAHGLGFVHGDLKPENVFLVASPGGGRSVKVADFGMNALSDEGAAAFFTSPAYLAPEQIRDPEHVDARADVWALGVMLHQAIAGTLPFAASTISAMLVAVAFDEAAALADVPPALAALVKRCLAKEPKERPANATALARELATALAAPDGASSEPPLAMTVDAQVPSALKTAPYPLMMHSEVVKVAAPAATATPASDVVALPLPPRLPALGVEALPGIGLTRGPDAVERRRRGAIAAACAAGVLALVGFALPANDDVRSARDSERPPIMPPGEGTSLTHEPGEPPVFVPPSFQLPEIPSSVREDDVLGHLDAPVSVPVPPMPPSTPMPPSQLDTALSPAARTMLRQLPVASKRPTLAVREDPYTRGFTHPTRLADTRK